MAKGHAELQSHITRRNTEEQLMSSVFVGTLTSSKKYIFSLC